MMSHHRLFYPIPISSILAMYKKSPPAMLKPVGCVVALSRLFKTTRRRLREWISRLGGLMLWSSQASQFWRFNAALVHY